MLFQFQLFMVVTITILRIFDTLFNVLEGCNSRPTWISQDNSNERINKGIQGLGGCR